MTHIGPVRAGKENKRTALEKRHGKSSVKELLFSWSDRVVVISGLYNADGLKLLIGLFLFQDSHTNFLGIHFIFSI